MEIMELTPGSVQLTGVRKIYMSSFPADERRSFTVVRRYLKCSRRPFHILAALEQGEVIGFLSFWEFDNFRYIEHLATDSNIRGRGIGKHLLQHFLSLNSLPVVIEVEIPQDEMSVRRVNFYNRLGFVMRHDFYYMQPPYDAHKNPLEMKLMTYGDLKPESLQQAVEILKLRVYNVKV